LDHTHQSWVFEKNSEPKSRWAWVLEKKNSDLENRWFWPFQKKVQRTTGSHETPGGYLTASKN
jgi:hypothetical protein